jgi:chaperonin GroES
VSTVVTPLADRVVAVREKAEAKTVSGLYLPDSAKEKPAYAVVESVGPDVKSLKKGDKIVFREYAPTELKVSNTEYLIIKEEDVLATIA